MAHMRFLNMQWIKASLYLLLALFWLIQAQSTASYLFAAGSLCFAWCEAFRKYKPPMKLSFTVKQIYSGFKNSEYRPERMILIIGTLGTVLWICSLIVGIAHLIQPSP